MMQKYWGLSAVINLYECDSDLIKNPKIIKDFIIELCDFIKMRRQGDVLIDRFGEGKLEGYSVMQFIQTSSITAHFDEEKNRTFIDIFSCKEFDSAKALKFCQLFFKAKNVKMKVIKRD
ncbi:S-adenosylmethionine decarboxylase [Candidatus Parcubacteria bacterium]|nr:S-adenosylmethionine decarboxylase [Candidatus Parcubacteria bacterium]